MNDRSNQTRLEFVPCPGCSGNGFRSAMSGGHIAYDCVCEDCKGRGQVTQDVAAGIHKRHEDWVRRSR